MPAKSINEYGTIFFSEDVLIEIAYQAAIECYGLVGFSSRNSSGIIELLTKNKAKKGFILHIEEDIVDIELSVILQYGTKISVVADNIMDTIRYSMESQTGLQVRNITVRVQGVKVQK